MAILSSHASHWLALLFSAGVASLLHKLHPWAVFEPRAAGDATLTLTLSTTSTRPSLFFVVSHPRSGTHLAMDHIANAVPHSIVIKTNHALATVHDVGSCECWQWMLAAGHVVHAYRDVRDVFVSTYFYEREWDPRIRRMRFSDFVNSSAEIERVARTWGESTASWAMLEGDGVLQLPFDDSRAHLPLVRYRLAKLAGRDTRAALAPRPHVAVSSVLPGSGRLGSSRPWQTHLPPQTATRLVELGAQHQREVLTSGRAGGGQRVLQQCPKASAPGHLAKEVRPVRDLKRDPTNVENCGETGYPTLDDIPNAPASCAANPNLLGLVVCVRSLQAG